MKDNKISKHFRLAALQVNYEGGDEDTLKVPKLWNQYGFNVEQLFHTHAEMYNAIYDHEKHQKIVQEYLQEAESQGVQIILYMNCHILSPSQDEYAPEWAILDEKEDYLMCYDIYKMNCVNSPWNDYFESCLQNLKDFNLAGIFFDGIALRHCYCKYCQSKFKKKYGKEYRDSSLEEKDEFSMETLLEAKNRYYKKVKEINPNWLAYFNESFHDRTLREVRENISTSDIIGTEGGFQFYGEPKRIPVWRCGYQARLIESLAEGKPKVIFMAGDHKCWSWYLHTPAESQAMYASTIANGSSVWYGLHSSTEVLNGKTGDAIQEIVHFDRENDEVYQNSESIAQVAIFNSFDTLKYYPTSVVESDFYSKKQSKENNEAIGYYEDSLNGAIASLFYSHVPFDVVTEINSERFCEYQVILMPTSACIRDKSIDDLRDYVNQGGVLIMDSETSLYDEEFNKRSNFGLCDLIGADFESYRHNKIYDFSEVGEELKDYFSDCVSRLPAPFKVIKLKNIKGNVLANLCEPQPGALSRRPQQSEYPFIIKNSYGKGCVYYISGTFFELYYTHGISHYRKIIRKLLEDHVVDNIKLLGAPEAVEITTRKCNKTGHIFVHLVNYSGAAIRPMETVMPLNGLKLKVSLPFSSARSRMLGKELNVSRGEVELPEIGMYDVIQLS